MTIRRHVPSEREKCELQNGNLSDACKMCLISLGFSAFERRRHGPVVGVHSPKIEKRLLPDVTDDQVDKRH